MCTPLHMHLPQYAAGLIFGSQDKLEGMCHLAMEPRSTHATLVVGQCLLANGTLVCRS